MGGECVNGSIKGSDMAGSIRFNPDPGMMYCILTFAKPFVRPPVCVGSQQTTFGTGPYAMTVSGNTTTVSFMLHKIPGIDYDGLMQPPTVDISYICLDAPIQTLDSAVKIRSSDYINTTIDTPSGTVVKPQRLFDAKSLWISQ
jgi:hypothetical protein